MSSPNSARVDLIDINKKTDIAIVQDTEDDIDSDENEFPSYDTKDSSGIDTPHVPASVVQPTREIPRPTRRTRGVSILPVRQSDHVTRRGSSPPQTPSPLKPLCTRDNLHPSGPTPEPAKGRQSSNNKRGSFSNVISPDQSIVSPNNTHSGLIDNDRLLSTYISQLASKEAHVGDLRVALSNLRQELQEAEAELAEFKDNGKKLAEIVHGDNHNNGHAGKPSAPKHLENEGQKHMIGMGRRVVDEIGSQFWAFLDDVKSATMGNAEFEKNLSTQPSTGSSNFRPNLQQTRQSLTDNPFPHDQTMGAPQSPPRRQLSPKQSIQNFLKNRSTSPIRGSLSPSKSPSRQEIAEHRASQRVRESERLSRKLSHINLRSPVLSDMPVEPTNPQSYSQENI